MIWGKLLPWPGLHSPLPPGHHLWDSLQPRDPGPGSRILYRLCLLVSTQATLYERGHPFSVPQLPCPVNKEIQAYVYTMPCALWMTVSGLGPSLAAAEAHGLRLLSQDLAVH